MGTNTGPNTFFAAFDHDAYFRPAGVPATLVDWKDGTTTAYESCATLNQTHAFEADCEDMISGAEPFFVDAANHDYRVRPGSVAMTGGAPLPADVATALGLAAGAMIPLGAVTWRGIRKIDRRRRDSLLGELQAHGGPDARALAIARAQAIDEIIRPALAVLNKS